MHRLACLLVLASCTASSQVMFHPSDPSYVARSGPRPPVILEATGLPTEAVRSVGLVEVTARDRAAAVELAARRGAELGCTWLVEHAVFEARRGVALVKAHAGMHHPPAVKHRVTLQLDCVVRVQSA